MEHSNLSSDQKNEDEQYLNTISTLTVQPIEQSATSANQIKKLTKSLREESKAAIITPGSLEKLQEFRVSYKTALSTVFNVLSEESKRVRSSSVVTYRIKRIESILSKLKRFPTMQLNTMADIAGCRCIVDSERDIRTIQKALEKRINVQNERDYIIKKAPDGYSALHLFVNCNDDKKPIEIQLRTKSQHNWATFVEIIDVIYDTKIKEGQSHPELERFCFLLSDIDSLNHKTNLELLETEKRYNIYSKLSEVFSVNYIITRKQWLTIENKKKHNFFIIEVDADKKTQIESYPDFEVAEVEYLKRFNNAKTNVVLTHMHAPSYKAISTAYSNYILSMHKFQEDMCSIAQSTVKVLQERKHHKKAKEFAELYSTYIKHESESITNEMDELRKSVPENDQQRKKFEEWAKDLTERMAKRREILDFKTIDLSLPEIIGLMFLQLFKK